MSKAAGIANHRSHGGGPSLTTTGCTTHSVGDGGPLLKSPPVIAQFDRWPPTVYCASGWVTRPSRTYKRTRESHYMQRQDRSLNITPASVRDYRDLARRRLPRQLFDYIDGGAYEEKTMAANVADLAAIHLRQRVLRDVDNREVSVTVLGQELSMPVILAPVGLAGMFAPRAEVQVAVAAQEFGVQFCESTGSICSVEEGAQAAPRPPWFQLYVMRDRGFTQDLISRAQAVGCDTLMLTVDLAVVGARYRDTRNGLSGRLNSVGKLSNTLDLVSHPRWIKDVALGGKPLTFGNLTSAVPGARMPSDFQEWVESQFDPSVTWEDIAWIRENWKGKLILKGILDSQDAIEAVNHGVDGIVVSNHGGRQLDAVPSTTAALPIIVEAVGGQLGILVDGGIRSGLDLIKVLALGADAAMIGRPWAYAVAAGGGAAVSNVLAIIKEELEVALALTGTQKISAVTPELLIQSLT